MPQNPMVVRRVSRNSDSVCVRRPFEVAWAALGEVFLIKANPVTKRERLATARMAIDGLSGSCGRGLCAAGVLEIPDASDIHSGHCRYE
jgi:hypothetical protein